jgi:hypothetical protein
MSRDTLRWVHFISRRCGGFDLLNADDRSISRRQILSLAGSLAAAGLLGGRTAWGQTPTTVPAVAPTTAASIDLSKKRFKVTGDDLFLNNRRQKVEAFRIGQKAGLDGVQVDMGRMPGGKELINELTKPEVRQQFLDASQRTGVAIASLAWFAMYAWVLPDLPFADAAMANWVETMTQMNVKLGYMPLMSKNSTLREPEHADVWKRTVEFFKRAAPLAEKAGEASCFTSPYFTRSTFTRFMIPDSCHSSPKPL